MKTQECKIIWNRIYYNEEKVYHMNIPEIDQYVLFLYESGGMFQGCIDKDMDADTIHRFVDGGENTGPIVAWGVIEMPRFRNENARQAEEH